MVPFVDVLTGRGDFIRQILLNIIMMIPFGFLFPITQNHAVGFYRTVFFCFFICLSIELLQPLINGFRSADITDLITNVTGGMIGYVLHIAFSPITSWVLARLRK
jgi:glycopeptide antibiotics resistance protein